MKTIELVEHNGYGARRDTFNIKSIDKENLTIHVSNPCSFKNVITFSDRKKFEQLMNCGYTYLVCWGDIIEYIIKN